MKRVEAIKKRISNATLGPWESILGRTILSIRSTAGGQDVVGISISVNHYAPSDRAKNKARHEADAALIASAPADLTWLLDRLERAEEILRDISNDDESRTHRMTDIIDFLSEEA